MGFYGKVRGMSTVIAFPAVRGKPAGPTSAGRSSGRRAGAPGEPVVVILPVVRIERHDQGQDETARAFGPGPSSRKVL